MIRGLLTTVGVLVVVAVLIVGVVWAFQRQLIYLPTAASPGPGDAVGAQDVVLRTEDGLELTAWWFDAATPETERTVLVTPGNAGSRADRVTLARALARQGADVLVVDYRGYGGNPGAPDEEGLAADARAAHAHLIGERGVDPRRLVLFGESLGAGVAVRLALERPVGGLVLRSPFTSLADVGVRAYPLLPVRWLLRDRYPSLERIRRLEVPVVVVAGTADEVVPVEQSRALAAAARDGRLVEVPRARHNDAVLVHGATVVGAARM